MQNDALQYIINEFSVGNWAQNMSFYSLVVLLGWIVTIQVKTSTATSRKKQSVSK